MTDIPDEFAAALHARLQAHITGIAREVINEFQPAFLRAAKSGREAEAEAVRLSMMAEIQRRCEAETTRIMDAMNDDKARVRVLDDLDAVLTAQAPPEPL